MKKVLIAFSAVLLTALLLYMTTSVFDEFFTYLQTLPAPTVRLVSSGAVILVSLILITAAVLRKRR